MVEGVILRQVRAGLGQPLNRGDEGIILCVSSMVSIFTSAPSGSLVPGREDDHAVHDCSGHTHSYFLPLNLPQKQAAAADGLGFQLEHVPCGDPG